MEKNLSCTTVATVQRTFCFKVHLCDKEKLASPELAERSGCFRRRPFSRYSDSAYVYNWKDDLIDNRTVNIVQRRSATSSGSAALPF